MTGVNGCGQKGRTGGDGGRTDGESQECDLVIVSGDSRRIEETTTGEGNLGEGEEGRGSD